MDLAEIRKQVEDLPSKDLRDLLAWLKALESTRTRQERALLAQERATQRLQRAQKRKERRALAAAAKAARATDTLRRSVLWSIGTLLLFFALEAAVFRSGWYFKYLLPASSAGQLTFQVFWLTHEYPSRVPEVAVAGDSRIAEGFSARKAGLASGNRIRFWNIGVPGSAPRTWYYLLREGDPNRNRFRAIVLGIDHYSDADANEDLRDRPTDLFYVASQLRITDCFDFALSHLDPEVRRDALSGCFLKGISMRRDLWDFLADPDKRLQMARDWRNQGHGYIDGYGGKPESLAGLSVDFDARRISFPATALDWQRNGLQDALLPKAYPQTGAMTAYRRMWLNRIVDLYKGSKTEIILLELPRGPVSRPDSPVPARAISELASRPHVTVLPKDLFHDLERPELFADGLHLNRIGRPIFSERLGLKVAELLGPVPREPGKN
jgi:hypothetical protein